MTILMFSPMLHDRKQAAMANPFFHIRLKKLWFLLCMLVFWHKFLKLTMIYSLILGLVDLYFWLAMKHFGYFGASTFLAAVAGDQY